MKVYIRILGDDYEGDMIAEVYTDKDQALSEIHTEMEKLNSAMKKDFPGHVKRFGLHKKDKELTGKQIIKYRNGSNYYAIEEWDTKDFSISAKL